MTDISPAAVADSARVLALTRWLYHGPARLPSGAYLSWVSEEEGGFAYAEAAALSVSAACWLYRHSCDGALLDRIIPSLEYLSDCVGDDGLIWHRNTGYLFDTLLAVRAFQGAYELGVPGKYIALREPMTAAALGLIARRVSAVGVRENRWSTTFSPHLLKPLAALLSVPLPGSDDARETLVPALVQLMESQAEDGAYSRGPDGSVYLHAHAYALEGLTMLPDLTGIDPSQHLARGLEFLAAQQRPDGSFPRWNPSPDSEASGDVAAQAARLFAAAPGSRYRAAAATALAALSRLVAPSGAIYYSDRKRHENVWCSVFALQAFHAAAGGELAPGELV